MLVPQSLGTYLLGNVMTMTISDLQRPAPTALTYSPAIDRTLRIAVLVAVTLVTCTENLTTYAVGEMLTTYSRPAQEAIRQTAVALRSARLPSASANSVAVRKLHGRLALQSVVNTFVDTFAHQRRSASLPCALS